MPATPDDVTAGTARPQALRRRDRRLRPHPHRQGPPRQPGPLPDLRAAQADGGPPDQPPGNRPPHGRARAARLPGDGGRRRRRRGEGRGGQPDRAGRRDPVRLRHHALLLRRGVGRRPGVLRGAAGRRAPVPRGAAAPRRGGPRVSRAWPPRSPCISASGPGRICSRWATAAATSSATASCADHPRPDDGAGADRPRRADRARRRPTRFARTLSSSLGGRQTDSGGHPVRHDVGNGGAALQRRTHRTTSPTSGSASGSAR